MERFQYSVVPLAFNSPEDITRSRNTLNAGGSDGWEVISVVPDNTAPPGSNRFLVFLKRRIIN